MNSWILSLIGLFVVFGIGFWLRGQFDLIKVREDSVINRIAKSRKKPKTDESESDEKPPDIPVQTSRLSRFIHNINSGMGNESRRR